MAVKKIGTVYLYNDRAPLFRYDLEVTEDEAKALADSLSEWWKKRTGPMVFSKDIEVEVVESDGP